MIWVVVRFMQLCVSLFYLWRRRIVYHYHGKSTSKSTCKKIHPCSVPQNTLHSRSKLYFYQQYSRYNVSPLLYNKISCTISHTMLNRLIPLKNPKAKLMRLTAYWCIQCNITLVIPVRFKCFWHKGEWFICGLLSVSSWFKYRELPRKLFKQFSKKHTKSLPVPQLQEDSMYGHVVSCLPTVQSVVIGF